MFDAPLSLTFAAGVLSADEGAGPAIGGAEAKLASNPTAAFWLRTAALGSTVDCLDCPPLHKLLKNLYENNMNS
eukprot:CAMPEP_0184751466 /NCGR_PEP_ID=MMETSP0315-20130426/42956_1 /TAXON_ID=101924 /ORGANISM="Rhodosorus marinus, Strain UTEX LB 2760" /LENGTH=73 /DNA_ID=CAMNT_0027230693 /DNA_START=58 /DNA_END=276 /DNA_ORIENTATION=-